MGKIRLGIIGAGLIWDGEHKPTLLEMKDRVEFTAFSVRTEKNVTKLEQEFPGVPCYTDYEELLRSTEVDAVVILTPLALNAEITMKALQAGKHVFVEKPMAVNNEDSEKVIELEKKSGKKVFVLEQFRYKNPIRQLKEIISSGRIGKIVSFDRVAHSVFGKAPDNPEHYGNTDWRIQADFPLGNLFDGGIHQISELTDIFGTPEVVYAKGNKIREDFGEQDQVIMMLTYPQGITGTFSHSAFLRPSNNYFHIRGTKGTIQYSDAVMVVHGKEKEEIRTEKNDMNQVMWGSCLDVLSGKSAEVYGSKEAYQDISILDAVVQSLKSGQAVTLK